VTWHRGTLLTLAVTLAPCLAAYTAARRDAGAAPARPAKASFKHDIAPLVAKYCAACHGTADPKGGVALTRFKTDADAAKAPEVWEKVGARVSSQQMPPKGLPQPTAAERSRLTAWIDAALAQAQCDLKNPGRVTLRRLNRAEYDNTIRDLLGVTFHAADDFPSDDVGYGFDNIGDVLSMSPLLMEKYLAAAEKIAQAAIHAPEPGKPASEVPASQKRIFIAQPANPDDMACARKILTTLASRAYRRPATRAEVDRLVHYVQLARKQGDPFERGIQLALEAVLVSPNFLFRVELDPRAGRPGSIRPLNDYELASRLSYFLWCSMPDDNLFALAAKRTLHQPAVLEAQARRMLKDPKAHALVENFADQWLTLRLLGNFRPDRQRFPAFNEALRSDMLQETNLFFENIIREDRSVLDLLDAKYTFLNERLARHYGIEGVTGEQFRKVALTKPERGGLLTQASILTVTSNPTRTSPVKRGKWVLEEILGTPPPPPPPNVPELIGDEQKLTGTLRQKMEQHRKDPMCASCHARMDPLGFGLENYDAIGAWRAKDGDFPVDASGELPDGRKFNGPAGLKSILMAQKDGFVHNLAQQMLTFALGRGMESTDRCAVDTIAKDMRKKGYKFSALVSEIVTSEPFRLRQTAVRGN